MVTTDSPPVTQASDKPSIGDIVQVRTRHYVVEGASYDNYGTVLDLACMDEDAQGTELQIIWELEQDGRVVTKQAWEEIGNKGFDSREYFASFFNTLRWHCVTATDPRIFQSPFRAGIRLDPYQLEPLRKALVLPKVNLFIADDVGLGKTIEAGLIANELLLRRRIQNIVVACPPAMLGQWKDELETRFGLGFEILDRAYLEKIRQERGFGVNPWTTFPRFLVSHRLLIDENYSGPLREWLGNLKPGSLFIFDEAHHAAPASGAKYAIDSRITRAIRDLAPRFEHRLFLSATPHNGHSNSFSALLELLDPQRFTRGVPVTKANLESIMVRRLKEDIRQIAGGFPKRTIVEEKIDKLPEDAPELRLAELLEEYALATEEQLETSTRKKQIEFQLVVSNLQQRLFSSIESFARTLAVHKRSIENATAKDQNHPLSLLTKGVDRDSELANLEGLREDSSEADEVEKAYHEEIESASEGTGLSTSARRKALLDEMTSIAESSRYSPDARLLRLLEWMRENQCSGLGTPGVKSAQAGAEWTETRFILFTEYEATLRHIRDMLQAAIAGTEQADQRIEVFYGATPTDKREAIKNAFNTDPSKHPVRILLATDAAREGLNLQAFCHHLFHFDVPWNPSRLEQRNGRIDRKLQPADEVFCHYFRYLQRPEDRILETLVRKTETIKQELGSLSQILEGKVTTSLAQGIRRSKIDELSSSIEDASEDSQKEAIIADELESQRERNEELREQIEVLQRQLDQSRKSLHYDTTAFQSALSSSLKLSGFPELIEDENGQVDFPVDLTARNIDPTWSATLDSLRTPPKDGKRNYQWRKDAAIRPVTFQPPETIDNETVQLHLGHRISQRLLSRFLSQGFVHHDLSRACFAQSDDKIPRVVLLGKLGLYGPGASRLHEEIITVTARWLPTNERDSGLQPYARDAEARTMQILEEAMFDLQNADPLESEVEKKLTTSMADDVQTLLPHLQERGRAAEEAAQTRLAERSRIESEAIIKVLEAQKRRVENVLKKHEDPNQPLLFDIAAADEKKQLEENMRYWRKWLEGVDLELEREPARIRDFYEVKTSRIEPVGLVYLWPQP
jgi:SNF2 family DNA or RNA helicase